MICRLNTSHFELSLLEAIQSSLFSLNLFFMNLLPMQSQHQNFAVSVYSTEHKILRVHSLYVQTIS